MSQRIWVGWIPNLYSEILDVTEQCVNYKITIKLKKLHFYYPRPMVLMTELDERSSEMV